MTWNDDTDAVCPDCSSHGSYGFRVANAESNFLVTPCSSVWDFQQFIPHSQLKICAHQMQRDIECCAITIKIFVELAFGFFQDRRSFCPERRFKIFHKPTFVALGKGILVPVAKAQFVSKRGQDECSAWGVVMLDADKLIHNTMILSEEKLIFSYFFNIMRDFSFAKACMSTATSSSSTISTPVMVSITSSIETTPRRQPYSSTIIEICSRFSSIFSHI